MPNRILKESITTSATIDQLSDAEEALFYRLLVVVDDYGRFDATPEIVLGRCLARKIGKVSPKDVAKRLDRLDEVGLIRRYWVEGVQYLYVTTWDIHQQVRAKRSRYPEPTDIKCNPLIANDINGLSHARAQNPIQSNPIQSIVAQPVAPPSAPPELKEFDTILREFPTYVPSNRFYEDVQEKYAYLDLREEAIKMTAWLMEKRKKRCSVPFVLNWLSGAASRHAARAPNANGQHRPEPAPRTVRTL